MFDKPTVLMVIVGILPLVDMFLQDVDDDGFPPDPILRNWKQCLSHPHHFQMLFFINSLQAWQ